MLESRIIHQGQHDLVRWVAFAEAEQVIVTNVEPTLVRRHPQQRQPAKHRQCCTDGGAKHLILSEVSKVHDAGWNTSGSQIYGKPNPRKAFFVIFSLYRPAEGRQ